MNIAFFSDTYPPDKNGVSTSVYQLRKNLRLLGHSVYVYTVKHNKEIILEDEENVTRWPAVHFRRSVPEARIAFANPATISKHLLKNQIDIVHTHSEFSLGLTGRFVSRLTNIPHVHTMHTMWKDYSHYILNGLVLTHQQIARLFRAFVRPCTAIVAPSKKAMFYLQDIKLSAYHINNSLDILTFKAQYSPDQQDQIRQQYGFKKDDFIVLFIGRISNEKRISHLAHVLINAMKQQKSLKAMLIGHGDRSSHIQKYIIQENLQDRFILTGPIPHELIVNYYAISNLYCTVSLSEVQPMTIIEAVSMGIPILARDDEALDTLVQNGVNGYTLQTDEEVAHRLVELTQSEELVIKMGKESLKIAEQFTSEIQTLKLIELYEKVITIGRPHFGFHPTTLENTKKLKTINTIEKIRKIRKIRKTRKKDL